MKEPPFLPTPMTALTAFLIKTETYLNTLLLTSFQIQLPVLLLVSQQTFSLQAQVTQLTYELLNNRITLGLALGLGV